MRACVEQGHIDEARPAVAELDAIAEESRTAPLRARARLRRRPGGGARRRRPNGAGAPRGRRRSVQGAAARRSKPVVPAWSWRACWACSAATTPPSTKRSARSTTSSRSGRASNSARARAVLEALVAPPAAPPSEDRKGLTPARDRGPAADFRRAEQPGHRRAAVHQRAHGPPARRQHADQAQRVVPLGGRRPGRPARGCCRGRL